MSHYVKVKLELKNRDCIGKSLKKMGKDIVSNVDTIKDWNGANRKVEMAIDIKNSKNNYCLGFTKNSKGYDMVGDFYETGSSEDSFTKKFKQFYANEIAKEKVLRMGCTYREEVMPDKSIRIHVEKP